jgi:hypothetical protein
MKANVRFFFTLLLWLASIDASAGAKDAQAISLAKFPGANADLKVKLECLRKKSYPADIEICGLSGFGTSAHQNKIEDCLNSKSGKTIPLPNAKMMLVVQCSRMRVAAEFEKIEGKYSVISIAELVD